ncbi:leucyl/phenylalanyl-tRNA--protein transferase [Ottowia beijingensis]|uniref:leucyl/phenylalanyl-tRNA--protein transferase n=1 Tax=Ottowia beijingensis TaxID=1207057 RepID=UPI002FD91B05
MNHPRPALALLQPGEPFPPLSQAWPEGSPAPGLIAAGGALDVPTLVAAYTNTIFPWFSEGEPILWWSPDPRMVLQVQQFRLHRSLRKAIQRFRADAACEIRVDTAFDVVIDACAGAWRRGQSGTWIGPEMRAAYAALHRAGHAHSVETWIDGRLCAGLYCVGVGRAVFGESMFTDVPDGSKIALAALVALCRRHGLPLIDCQQNTAHLAFMGAAEMPRADFAAAVQALVPQPAPAWHFEPVYWNALMPPSPADR